MCNFNLTREWKRSQAIMVQLYCPCCQKKLTKRLKLTPDMIDGIIYLAFCEGSRHWIKCTEILQDEYYGEYDCEQVSRGGSVILHNRFNDEKYVLDLECFLSGVYHSVARHIIMSLSEKGKEDKFILNAKTSDEIIQYAIFDEIRYPQTEMECGVYVD